MLQIVLETPGRLVAAEAPEPAAAAEAVLVQVHRVGICGTDLHAFAGRQPFFTYPRVLGHELGVEVLEPGPEGSGLQPGDRCAVEPYLNCGRCVACRRSRPNCCAELRVLGVHVDGGLQPRLRVPSRKLHRAAGLDFDQLALVETLAIGAHAVERGAPAIDEFVLVVGLGPIGLGTALFARLAGARVALMDVNERRLEFARAQVDPVLALRPGPEAADLLRRAGGGEPPTCVFDATGNAQSMAASFGWPAHGGRLVFVGLVQGELAFSDPEFHRRELMLLASRNARPETFRHVLAQLAAGRIDVRPWITHRCALAELPAAFGARIAGQPDVVKAIVEVAG